MLRPDSFILRKTATLIALIVQVFAVYLFFRGHNLPGGGFIAGVASGIGLLLIILANGKAVIPRLLPFDPLRLSAWGLAIATLSGASALFLGDAFLTNYHYKQADFPFLGSLYLGTPLLFDLGVFLTVVGVVIKISVLLMDALDSQKGCREPAFSLSAAEVDRGVEEKDVS
jgi:multisubunit Na+/H+ antiporter MnhB subunit